MAAGAGYMAGKHMERGRDANAERDARLDNLEQQQYAAPPPQAPPSQPSGGISDAAIAQLKQLAQLHEQGILTDAEFDAQKQKLLSGA
jgi:hypothetical protein